MIQISFIGRVVADAQVRTSQHGTSYIDMRMAADGNGKDKETMWFHVRSFTTPTSMAQYFTKGKPLYVVGNYENSIYTTQDGRTGISNDVNATTITFLGLGKDEGSQQTTQTAKASATVAENTNKAMRNPSTATAPKASAAPAPVAAPVADDPDDDLPF